MEWFLLGLWSIGMFVLWLFFYGATKNNGDKF